MEDPGASLIRNQQVTRSSRVATRVPLQSDHILVLQVTTRLAQKGQTLNLRVTKWIPGSGGFIEADVVRWNEAVWKTGRRKGSKPVKVGERIVTGQILRIDAGDWDFVRDRERRYEGSSGPDCNGGSQEGPGDPPQAQHHQTRQARATSLER